MAKHREARRKAAETDTQRLIPPSHAPSVPGVHIPNSNKGDFSETYGNGLPANPYESEYMGDQTVNTFYIFVFFQIFLIFFNFRFNFQFLYLYIMYFIYICMYNFC